MMRLIACLWPMLLFTLGMRAPEVPVRAFPGAEGFGRHTTGGRGGQVFIVTSLADDGPGTLREAVKASVTRTIVFEVSGTIALASPLKITHGDVTIAGQSAPGQGICLRNYSFLVSANNVIIRYLRFRLGDVQQQQDDAITGLRRKDIIIDHCSMSWATDECATFYDNENFTLQWCIIAESLNHSVHEKGDHGYGGIWGGRGASFHHNLLAHHISRLPRFCGARYHKKPAEEIVDFRNNVIYNYRDNDSYGGEEGNHNLVNNYYKPGPATQPARRNRIVNPFEPYGKFYVAGNYVAGNAKVSANNWAGGVQCDDAQAVKLTEAVPVVDIPVQSAADAYEAVLAQAGASYRRDALDERVIQEVRQGTAHYGAEHNGIIDSQTDVGGWPALATAKVPPDTDRDGIPDAWEKDHDLQPDQPHDAQAYTLHAPYTNLEVYLNSLVP